MAKEKQKTLREDIEDFLDSNTAPAIATKFVLAFLALGGIAFAGALAPNLIKASKGFRGSGKYSEKQLKNAFYSLERRKFIKIKRVKNEKIEVKLTNKGKKRIRELSFENLKIEKMKKWDNKWRILIFDIPIKMNTAREALRKKIKELGFYQFQGSVWIYPYPCEDEILFVAEFFKVSRYIEVVTAENMLHNKELKKYFKLS